MKTKPIQRILVFQQHRSGESKIKGIRDYGTGQFELQIISIDADLPPVIDDPETYLSSKIRADVVLDFLKHPDLSYELAIACSRNGIPVVASGKKWRIKGAVTPPT